MAAKIHNRATLVEKLRPRRERGETVALANGIFDILHVGHLRYLEGARAEAGILVVGINGDGSARELKGPGRPVNPATERAELVAGFSCVDYVTIFQEKTAAPLIRALRPDVHCKGTDYSPETVPELEEVKACGGRVAIVGDPKSHSTRDVVRRIAGDADR
jgi:rfaE bifunctional protein nucleotidyltransferase chain/domain